MPKTATKLDREILEVVSQGADVLMPPHSATYPFSAERIFLGFTGVSLVVLSVWGMRVHGRSVYGAHFIEDVAVERSSHLTEILGHRRGLPTTAASLTETAKQAKKFLEGKFGKIRWQKALVVTRTPKVN